MARRSKRRSSVYLGGQPISHGVITHVAVGDSSVTAGAPVSIYVTALDASNQLASGYVGTVSFSGTAGTLPGSGGLTNSQGVFTATYTSIGTGTKTITATDTSTGSLTGSGKVFVTAAAATNYKSLTVPGGNTVTAGHAINLVLTPGDQFGNPTSNYAGTVNFTTADALAILPANTPWQSSFGSQKTFTVVLNTANATFTVTATDTTTASITKTTSNLIVVTDPFVLSIQPITVQNLGFVVLITATNHDGTQNPDYSGTVTFGSSDLSATLPANMSITGGIGSFTATLRALGLQTITVTDTASSAITGTGTTNVESTPGPVTHFGLSFSGLYGFGVATVTAGTAFAMGVNALDATGLTDITYTGTVTYTSSDTSASLPSPAPLFESGVGVYSVTTYLSGIVGFNAVDATNGIYGSNYVHVLPSVVTGYTITTPISTVNGLPMVFTVRPTDVYGNAARSVVHFTSNDTNAVLPANATIAAGTTGTFTATLKTTATKTITVSDAVTPAIATTSSNITVVATGAMHHFALAWSPPPDNAVVYAGNAITVTVVAKDASNVTVASYAGTVTFTSTDAYPALLPDNSTLTAGVGTFTATLYTAGTQTITATDTVTAGFHGTTSNIPVRVLTRTKFSVQAPGSATLYETVNFTATAQDAYNNTDTGYIGTAVFTSTDDLASLPAPTTLVDGTGVFQAAFGTGGTQTITTTDEFSYLVSGTSGGIVIPPTPGPIDHFTWTLPANIIGGPPFYLTLTAQDASNITVTNYTGTVGFEDSDNLGLPSDTTLTSGVGLIGFEFNPGLVGVVAYDKTTPVLGKDQFIDTDGTLLVDHTMDIGAGWTLGLTSEFAINSDSVNKVSGSPGIVGTVCSSADVEVSITVDADSTQAGPAVRLHGGGANGFFATISGTDLTIWEYTADTATPLVTVTGGAPMTYPARVSLKIVGTDLAAIATDGTTTTTASVTSSLHAGFTNHGLAGVQSGPNMTGFICLPVPISGSTAVLATTPGTATHFSVVAPAAAIKSAALTFTVTALDASNLLAAAYGGTIHFTSDATGTLPANAALSNGSGTFVATLTATGTKHITATDKDNGAIAGTSGGITVTSILDHFTVVAPASTTAGAALNVTVTAKDSTNTLCTFYTGSVHFTSNDGSSTLPANSTLTAGVGTFSATLNTVGTKTITASDSVTATLSGVSGNVTIVNSVQTHFAITTQTPGVTENSLFVFTVASRDQGNNLLTGYAGTVHFTSTDTAATLPVNSQLTSGLGTFTATLNTGGVQTITGTDTASAAITGVSGSILVSNAVVAGGFITTPFGDRVPVFGASPTVTSVQSGNWSSASTWSTGIVPAAGAIVTILAGHTVTYDVISTDIISVVQINLGGLLTFSTSVNTQLTVVTILVMEGGEYRCGTTGTPVNAAVSAQVIFADVAIDTGTVASPGVDPAQYGNGLSVFGKIQLHGSTKDPTFLRVATEMHAGDTTITLASTPTGWQLGDRLVIPDSVQPVTGGTASNHWEVRYIAGMSGATITLNTPLTYAHLGGRDGNNVLTYLPHVENMTRNVVFKSANPDGVRGHTMYTCRANIDMRYAEFFQMGRTLNAADNNTTWNGSWVVTHIGTQQKGRYALHIHHVMGPTTFQGNGRSWTVIGCSVDGGDFDNRAVRWGYTIHDSHYGLLQDCVCYNTNGWGYGTEEGNETENIFDHNFAVRVAGDGNRGDGGPVIGSGGEGWWLSGFNNHLTNNVIANVVTQGTGTAFLFFSTLDNINIPNYQGAYTTTVGQYTVTNPLTVPILEFSGNEAYGQLQALSIWYLGATYSVTYNLATSVIQDFTVWHCNIGFFNYAVHKLTFDNFIVYGDPNYLLAGVGSAGVTISDYIASYVTFTGCDIQSMNAGICVGVRVGITSDTGQLAIPYTIENCYLRNHINIYTELFNSSGGSIDQSPRITIMRNCEFVQPQYNNGSPDYNLYLAWSQSDGFRPNYNWVQLDVFLVYDYNQVVGNDFRIYYTQQLANFITPQTSPLGYGSPSYGLTNAQNLVQNHCCVAGAIAPATTTQSPLFFDGLIEPLNHFRVVTPATATAGAATSFTVTLKDPSNNTVTSYTGTVQFTSTDTAATLPANSGLTAGVGTFSATLNTVGTQTLTAADTVSTSITGTSSSFSVIAGSHMDHFTVVVPATATGGNVIAMTCTAKDQNNALYSSYAGTVAFTSSDTNIILPNQQTPYSISFDGSNDYINVTDAASINFSGDFSIACWFKTSTKNKYMVSKQKGTTPYTGYGLSMNNDAGGARILFEVSDGTYSSVLGTSGFSDGAWHLAICTRVGTTGTIYVDGSSHATGTVRGGDTTFAVDMKIGDFTGGGSPFNGLLSIPRVFNRGLSGTEVTQIWNGLTGPTDANGWWKFNEGSGTTAADSSGNSNTGTLTNGPTWSSSIPTAIASGSGTLTSGIGTFSATLKTSGTKTFTATDTVTASITGTSGNCVVSKQVLFSIDASVHNNDYVTFGDPSSLNLGTGDFTIMAWVNVSAVTSSRTLFGLTGTNVKALLTLFVTSAVAQFQLFDGTHNPFARGTTTITGGWHHIAATRSGGVIRLFVDGVQEATDTDTVGDLNIGTSRKWVAFGEGLNNVSIEGLGADPRVYLSALTQPQIAAIVAGAGLTTYAGRWKFNEGSGTAAANSGTAASADGTLTNAPTWSSTTPPPLS